MHARTFFTLAATLASFATTTLAAPAAGGGGKATPAPLTVVDATGKTVGLLGSSPSASMVAFGTVNGRFSAITLGLYTANTNLAQIQVNTRPLVFTTPDCTGTVYLPAGSGAGAAPVIAHIIGGIKYLYTGAASPVTTITPASVFLEGSCSGNADAQYQVVPASAPINAATLFTEPFTVQ